jgi:hypothetical protein
MHKAHCSQLPSVPIVIEETHEALIAVQVLTTSKEQFLLVNDSEKKYCCIFLQNQLKIS